MKYLTIILLFFGLIACNSQSTKNIDTKENQPYKPHKQAYRCDFDSFIRDKNISQQAKDIYLDNEWDIEKEEQMFDILDSLSTKNKQSRLFYFKVITKTYPKSDGSYSEMLGLTGKEYVENNTKEFISVFDYSDCFTKDDLITWADIVILEFSLLDDGEYNKSMLDEYVKKLQLNCEDCSLEHKQKIYQFGAELQKKWRKFIEEAGQY